MASVTLEHLSKIYANGFVSLNDVSLRVDNGEFITLHGPQRMRKIYDPPHDRRIRGSHFREPFSSATDY